MSKKTLPVISQEKSTRSKEEIPKFSSENYLKSIDKSIQQIPNSDCKLPENSTYSTITIVIFAIFILAILIVAAILFYDMTKKIEEV